MFGHRFFGARYFGPRYWGPGAAVAPDEPTGRSRRRKKPLFNVSFDGQQVGVESAKEVLELARLSNSIPKVELLPFVDYGSRIKELKRAIATLEAERNRLIEQEDEEIILLMLH